MRDATTYRSERRMAWWAIRQNLGSIPWSDFNANLAHMGYGIGAQSKRMATAHISRSKYMPHIGKKERFKGLARNIRHPGDAEHSRIMDRAKSLGLL